MFNIDDVPQFWQGVLASIVAAASIAAVTAGIPFFRSRVAASRDRRLREIADLRMKIVSPDSVLRVEGYFHALFKMLRYLFVGSAFWVLGEVAAPIFYPAIFFISFALMAFVLGLRWLAQLLKPMVDVTNAPPQPGDLVIVEATYGARDHVIDVTDAVRKSVAGGRLRLYVGNQLGGDPCPGTPKTLQVQYEYKGTPAKRSVDEGEDLSLP